MNPLDDYAGRLAELVLHIAEHTRSERYFGVIKLHKVLFYADFSSYRELGRPITGAQYLRLDHGPAARELPFVLDQLIEQGAAALHEELVGSQIQFRVEALRSADVSVFADDEMRVVASVLDEFRGRAGSDRRETRHQEIGWRLAYEGELIPYFTAYLMAPPLSDHEIAHLRAEVDRLRLTAKPV